MKALTSVLLVVVSLFAINSMSACDSGGDGFTMPTAATLTGGAWVNDDAGTTRAFEFLDNAYTLYFYPTGSAPAVAQHGTYTIEEGRLVTTVVDAPVDPSLAGQQFANVIVDFDAKALTLESTSSATGKRVFAKTDAP